MQSHTKWQINGEAKQGGGELWMCFLSNNNEVVAIIYGKSKEECEESAFVAAAAFPMLRALNALAQFDDVKNNPTLRSIVEQAIRESQG